MTANNTKINLTESLEKLSKIVDWFEEQQDVDIEAGLDKVKEAAILIKSSKTRLTEIENEFKEIEKEIEDVEMEEIVVKNNDTVIENDDVAEDIPF